MTIRENLENAEYTYFHFYGPDVVTSIICRLSAEADKAINEKDHKQLYKLAEEAESYEEELAEEVAEVLLYADTYDFLTDEEVNNYLEVGERAQKEAKKLGYVAEHLENIAKAIYSIADSIEEIEWQIRYNDYE